MCEQEIELEEAENHIVPPFLMVVTEVDQVSETVILRSIFDWEVPAEMYWFYGAFSEVGGVEDKVGECYRVTMEKLS